MQAADHGLNSTAPLRITQCVQINADLTWSLYVHNHPLDSTECSALKSIPQVVNPEVISNLFITIDNFFVCAGHYDIHFVKMLLSKKEKLSHLMETLPHMLMIA